MFEKYDILHLLAELVEGLVGWQQACGISYEPLDAFEVQEFGELAVVEILAAAGLERCDGLQI